MQGSPDGIERWLVKAGLPVDRENYIAFNWVGNLPQEWTPEYESELPEHLQDWTLFEMRNNVLTYVGPPID
jgi:hypothetical protein